MFGIYLYIELLHPHLLLSDFLQEFYVLPILDMWYGMYKVNAHKILKKSDFYNDFVY